MKYVALEKLIHLYDGYRQVFLIEGLEILLLQEDGRRYVIQANCPHNDWPMLGAPVMGDDIICSKHGWSFNMHSGRPANERAGNCKLRCYKIAYEDNTIGLVI
jgi:nitrite reductase/ring-hydroxylating ferredoxin subunit